MDSSRMNWLTVVDITSLGLATALGTGVYVALPQLAREDAGPSVVLSVLLAAVTTLFSGLCYAELSARLPKTGCLLRVYVNVATFLVDWNMVLELSTGSAVSAKALVQYVDTIFKDTTQQPSSDQVFFPRAELDVAACVILLFLGVSVALWVKPLCVINNVMAVAGVLTVFAVVAVGLLHVDADNWTDGPGFFPRGASGIMSASGTCVFAFVGYNVIGTASGETRRPCSTVATATTVTFVVGLLACFMVGVVITLVAPSTALSDRAPLANMLLSVRTLHGLGYFAAAGAVGSLLSAAFATLFSLSRLIHFMAKEGFLFGCFAAVSSSRGTPWVAALAGAVLSASMALVLDLHSLVTILGAGTGLAGATVASAILVHRYGHGPRSPTQALAVASFSRDSTATPDGLREEEDSPPEGAEVLRRLPEGDPAGTRTYGSTSRRQMSVEFAADESFRSSLMDLEDPDEREPTGGTWRKVWVATGTSGFLAAILGWQVSHGVPGLFGEKVWVEVAAYSTVVAAMLGLLGVVVAQPRRRLGRLMDSVPCVPLLPLVALWLHVQLLAALHAPAWVRLLVWSVVGLILRFIMLLLKVRSSCEDSTGDPNYGDALYNREELVGLTHDL